MTTEDVRMAADAITFLNKTKLRHVGHHDGARKTKSLFRAPLGQVELGANTWGTMRALQLYVSLFLGWVA